MQRISLLLWTIFVTLFFALAAPVPVPEPAPAPPKQNLALTGKNGRGTYFHPGRGNCGKKNKDGDLIVAISKKTYDRFKGKHCDMKVEITNKKNKKKVTATIRDSCQSCGPDDIDMSPGTFKKLESNLGVGVLKVDWKTLPK